MLSEKEKFIRIYTYKMIYLISPIPFFTDFKNSSLKLYLSHFTNINLSNKSILFVLY